MVFGRRKRADDPAESTPDVVDEAPSEPVRVATTGPWDVADAPDDERARIDLGGLRVLVPSGVEVRVEVSPEGQVVAATAVDRGSQLQLNAFAAPRAEGIWDEVRAEIAETLNAQRRGSATEGDGPFGTELRANLPAEGAGKSSGTVPARFVGVDGPRWFLRALLAGPVAGDPVKAKPFEEALRRCVVVRGSEPLPVREPVPLQLPSELELPTDEQPGN